MAEKAQPAGGVSEGAIGRYALLAEVGWFALFCLFVFLLHYLRLENGDIWEHVKMGQIIVAARGIPEGRPILWTLPGQPWLPQSWLFQVLVYGLYRAGGLLALYLWEVALVVAAFWLLYRLWRRERGSRLAGAALIALGALASAPRFQIRPDACTAVALALLLGLWAAYRHGRRKMLWALIPLGLIWANLHVGVLLGLLVLLVLLVGETWERLPWARQEKRGWPWQDKRWRHLLALSAAFALSTLITPSGWRLHAWLLSPELRQMIPHISENRPLWEVFPYFKSPLLALTALTVTTIALVIWGRKSIPRAAPLLLVVFLPIALRMMRQVWPLVMVSLGVCALALRAIREQQPAPQSLPLRLRRWTAAAGWVLLLCAMAFGVQQRWSERAWTGRRTGVGVNADLLPIGAANWLMHHRPPGRLFNTFEDSYYLAFRLWPTYRALCGRLHRLSAGTFPSLRTYRPVAQSHSCPRCDGSDNRRHGPGRGLFRSGAALRKRSRVGGRLWRRGFYRLPAQQPNLHPDNPFARLPRGAFRLRRDSHWSGGRGRERSRAHSPGGRDDRP